MSRKTGSEAADQEADGRLGEDTVLVVRKGNRRRKKKKKRKNPSMHVTSTKGVLLELVSGVSSLLTRLLGTSHPLENYESVVTEGKLEWLLLRSCGPFPPTSRNLGPVRARRILRLA